MSARVISVAPTFKSEIVGNYPVKTGFLLSVFHGAYPVHSSGLSMWLGGA